MTIPSHLLPADGRFGSGPTRVRAGQLAALTAAGTGVLGTSHRQAPVERLVSRVRSGVAELLGLPDGYEVVLGNGGSTAFWDAAAFCLVRERAQHAVHGEFSSKFATVTDRAPFLAPSVRVEAAPGSIARLSAVEGVDAHAYPHNETSTGALAPVERIGGADALTLVDATSAAGAVPVDLAATDAYYFAPQKAFGGDGGLWVATLSPAAVARVEELTASRWVPAFLDLGAALASSRKDQTVNTPALATLVLLAEQLDWMLERGGLEWSAGRSAENAAHVYAWAEQRSWAAPFVEEAYRSPVVATVDLEGVDAAAVAAVLREHGVVDVEPYRKLGRNQLRFGLFPAVPLADVEALTACIDHVVEALG
ncbi:phosphoserine transaminase [Georgenia sp. Z1344]|uniref:phosphoserine transaminase n=1 Tax=Georgenia sp. Z1344 TaxID=3416706 RepID=UPI003CF97BCA